MSTIWREVKNRIALVLLILGLIFGTFSLTFSLIPPSRLSSSPIASPPTIDVGVTRTYPLDNSRTPAFNETDFIFESQSVFLNFTFSKVNSSSDVLVVLPFRIENVSTPFGYGASTLNYGWKFLFHPATSIAQDYWIENASFTNGNGYSNMLLNGSLTMEVKLDHDIFATGPWQESARFSLGSNTTPLYSACPRLLSCMSAYSGSGTRLGATSYVEIGIHQNEIVGDGTFPSPSLVASNNFGRGVAWIMPASKYFHDIQLFVTTNDFDWTFPLPASYQPIFMSVGFVVLQACFTKIFSDLKKSKGKLDQGSILSTEGRPESTGKSTLTESLQTPPTPQSAPPPTLLFEKEKVGMFWDFRKSLLLTALGFYLSAYVALMVNLDRLIPIDSWRIPVAVVVLIVLLYAILETFRNFERAAVQVTAMMKKVESGQPLGDLTQLLGIRVLSIIASLRLIFSRTGLRTLVLEGVTTIDDYQVAVRLRNKGKTDLRIIAYSLDKSDIIYQVPMLVIGPGAHTTLKVARDVSLKTKLEQGRTHQINVWTDTGLSATFSFNL